MPGDDVRGEAPTWRTGIPIVGPTLAFRRNPLAFAVAPYREVGPVWQTSFNGRRVLMAGGAEVNAAIWSDTGRWSYHDAAAVFREQFDDRYLTQLDGRPHLDKRRRMAPAFRVRELQRRSATMATAVEQELDALGDATVDLRGWCKRVVVRLAGRALVDVDLPAGTEEEISAFEADLLVGASLGSLRRAWFARRAYRARRAAVLQLLGSIVDERLAAPGDDLFSRIANGVADRDEAVGDLVLLLQAGSETTAHLLLWSLLLTAGRPGWARLVEDEARAWSPDTPLTAASAPHLWATVTEVERLRPPVPIGFRVAARDGTLCGVDVPAGTAVVHAQTLCHVLPEHYADPWSFRPERFLGVEPDASLHGTFGGGTHVCIGAPLARLETALVLAAVGRRGLPTLLAPLSGGYRFVGAVTPVERHVPVRFGR